MTTVHLGACIVALLAGAAVAVRPKGTRTHRALGLLYVGSTFLYCGASFFVFRLTGHFTVFHAIAIQNLLLVSGGIAFPWLLRTRMDDWYVWHLRFMLYSYVALVVTGFRFLLPYFPPGNRVVPTILFAAVPFCCWTWIERRVVPRWRARLGPVRRVFAPGLEA